MWRRWGTWLTEERRSVGMLESLVSILLLTSMLTLLLGIRVAGSRAVAALTIGLAVFVIFEVGLAIKNGALRR